MKHIRAIGVPGVVIGIVALVVSCGPSPAPDEAPSVVPISIQCEVFYRPSVTQSLSEGQTITLGTNGDREGVEFDDMAFDVQYYDDQFEGRSLVVSVSDRESDAQIVGHLYQMDRTRSVSNQFLGGHGFTGLVYVYHPSSQAELQYFCRSGQE